MAKEKTLSSKEAKILLEKLEDRFKKNSPRHKNIKWENVKARLENNPGKLWSLNEMEKTGGEPDVVAQDKKSGGFIFFDCAEESPKPRRSLCYDRKALDERKEFKPKNSAVDMANEMGVEMLTEEQYRYLQTLGKFDSKTSSWLLTPPAIRKLGGAILLTFALTMFLYITMAHHPIMQEEDSGRL